MELPADPGLLWPSPRTFFGAPRCEDLETLSAAVAFLGVPYDAGTLQPYIPHRPKRRPRGRPPVQLQPAGLRLAPRLVSKQRLAGMVRH